MKTFEQRTSDELAFYAECHTIHDLPAIQQLWAERYLAPKLAAVGFKSLEDFYLSHLRTIANATGEGPARVVSLGAGNCDLEVRLAVELERSTRRPVTFECLELNPAMLERGRHTAISHGIEDRLTFVETDFNQWHPAGRYDVCIASHALHHVVELEHLFDAVAKAIGPTGVFLVNDMIGRNGHMRWPEALNILEPIWRTMPDRYKHNRQLQRFEPEYENWDCSVDGFEGIRAQEILPLLMERLSFEAFVGFTNILGPFIDRSFGPNFDIDREEDVDFIVRVAELDELAIDLGVVKPTQMIAALRADIVTSPRVYRHWTPEFSLRRPDAVESSSATLQSKGLAGRSLASRIARQAARVGWLRKAVGRVPQLHALARRLLR